MSCIKDHNQLVNTLLFPGSIMKSSYNHHSFNEENPDSQLLYIPIAPNICNSCICVPTFVPAVLVQHEKNAGTLFCIHFHGNACDAGQITPCGVREGYIFNAHYLIVEYPSYGIMHGFASESSIDVVATAVYSFVVDELKVPPAQIVLIGRSIGTGPVCTLASFLERTQPERKPGAIVLQSPYSSIRNAAADLLGIMSYCFLDRWENWRPLLGTGSSSEPPITAPVLFIHADHDQIIDCHHSIMIHEARIKAGLISELFTQESTAEFTKGHNYYDYDNDVIIPCSTFFLKYVKQKDLIQISSATLAIYKLIPLQYQDKPLKSKCTTAVICMWAVCPCVFCTECSVACTYFCIRDCLFSCFGSGNNFVYVTKKQRKEKLKYRVDSKGLMATLIRTGTFNAAMVEENPNPRRLSSRQSSSSWNTVEEGAAVHNPIVPSSGDGRKESSSTNTTTKESEGAVFRSSKGFLRNSGGMQRQSSTNSDDYSTGTDSTMSNPRLLNNPKGKSSLDFVPG